METIGSTLSNLSAKSNVGKIKATAKEVTAAQTKLQAMKEKAAKVGFIMIIVIRVSLELGNGY